MWREPWSSSAGEPGLDQEQHPAAATSCSKPPNLAPQLLPSPSRAHLQHLDGLHEAAVRHVHRRLALVLRARWRVN